MPQKIYMQLKFSVLTKLKKQKFVYIDDSKFEKSSPIEYFTFRISKKFQTLQAWSLSKR